MGKYILVYKVHGIERCRGAPQLLRRNVNRTSCCGRQGVALPSGACRRTHIAPIRSVWWRPQILCVSYAKHNKSFEHTKMGRLRRELICNMLNAKRRKGGLTKTCGVRRAYRSVRFDLAGIHPDVRGTEHGVTTF